MDLPQKVEPESVHAPVGLGAAEQGHHQPSTSSNADRMMPYRDPTTSGLSENRENVPAPIEEETIDCNRIGRAMLGMPLVLIVFALIFWSWFVHILRMDASLFKNNHQALAIVDGVVFNLLLLLLTFAYIRCSFSNPGYVPRASSPSASAPLVQMREGDKHFCVKCNGPKPDRAHHCRLCGRCVHRMDHHCPWVNNCVGRDNYKFFVLFLGYTCLAALYNTVTVSVWASRSATADLASDAMGWAVIWINIFATGVFGAVLFFFCGFHLSLIAKNQTTIESMDRRSQYDLGSVRANFKQVLGSNAWIWILPVAAGRRHSAGTAGPGQDLESGGEVAEAGARS